MEATAGAARPSSEGAPAADPLHARLRAANRAYADAVHVLVDAEADLRVAEGIARARARRRWERAQEEARRAGAALADAAAAYHDARWRAQPA